MANQTSVISCYNNRSEHLHPHPPPFFYAVLSPAPPLRLEPALVAKTPCSDSSVSVESYDNDPPTAPLAATPRTVSRYQTPATEDLQLLDKDIGAFRAD